VSDPVPTPEPTPPEPATAQGLAARLRAALPVLQLAGVFLALSWLWRVLLLGGRAQGELVWIDLRGGAVDLWLALLLALAFSGRRILAGVAAIVWVALHYAVFQHVDVLGVLPNVKHTGFLGDATFVEGSVKGVRFMPLCALSLIGGAWGAAWVAERAEGARRQELCGVALALGLLFLLVPVQPGYARWRQTNAIANLPADLLSNNTLEGATSDPAVLADVAAVFSADLSGAPRPRPAGAKRAKNVLVLVFERLSAGYTTQGQATQGVDYSLRLPRLSKLVDEHLFFPNYFSHQAQSNRGLYALLAGELPHLRTQTSKMTEVTSGTRRRQAFLPAALRAQGYRSVFVEATPLHFMGMDQFMRQIGFDDAQDSSDIKRPRARGGWGVDDGSLLDHTAEVIGDLEQGTKPWFVTVFSSGTHHPYTIPDPEFRKGEEDFVRSFHYLDQVLDEFLSGLEKRGVLEDTLVLITCDESAGLPASFDEPTERLDKNWGFLLALTPEGWKGQEPAPYGQADLALSILDYLGLAKRTHSFSGRSVFRSYAEPRDFYLGNTYTRQLAVYSKTGTLAVFDERLNLIASRAYDPQGLLKLGEARPEPAGLRDRLLGVLRRGEAPATGKVSYAFAGTAKELSAEGWGLVVSGQWFETPPDSILELDLDLVLHPEPGQAVFLWTKLNDNSGNRTLHGAKSGPFLAGGRRRLKFRFHSAAARNRVEVRLGVDQAPGTTRIEVKQAQLRVLSRSSAPRQPDGSVEIQRDTSELAGPGAFTHALRGRSLKQPGPRAFGQIPLATGALLAETRELDLPAGLELVLRGKAGRLSQPAQLCLVTSLAETKQVALSSGEAFELRLETPGGPVSAKVVYAGPTQDVEFEEFVLELQRP
jgi:sulfatase-like protein